MTDVVDSPKKDFDEKLREYVKHYLKNGLTVIRLKYHDKRPAGEWEKNIITTSNLEDLLGDGPWNVGILLGKRSKNLIVFDYESREALAEHYEILEEHGLTELLDTWVVETGKGVHVYYLMSWRDPHAAELIKPVTLNTYFSKLEIRGDGNYVVAPPSIHPSGRRYQFVQGPYLPLKILTAKEYAILLYTYAKTGDITAVKFEELHKLLSKLYPSYHEIDVIPSSAKPKTLPISKFSTEMEVSDDANAPVIVKLVAPLLPYVGRQDFTLTLASALARLGVHPLKSAEILAALLDDKRFTERRSERDKNEAQEAKQRVQAWTYAYNNVWRILRGKTLEEAFPGIKGKFIEVLKEKSSKFGEVITESWWYAPSTSGDRLRGVPALTDMVASAIEAMEKAHGKSISPESARELAWQKIQAIIRAARPKRRKIEQLTRLTRVYVIGTLKVQEVYLVPGKNPTQTYLSLEQKLADKNPQLHQELKDKALAFKLVTIPVIFQGRDGVLYKGMKKVYYYRVLGGLPKEGDENKGEEVTVEGEQGEWESFAVEYVQGVPLTAKPIEVLKAVFYEGTAFVKLYVEGKIIEGNIETVIDTLVKGGITTSYEKEVLRKYFTWISQSFRGTAYLAPGIYENNGRFEAILPTTTDHLLPHSPLTSLFVDRLKEWAQKVSKEEYENFLQGIIKYKEYLPISVYYATMGYLGIAGFLSSILDLTGALKPALLLIGPRGTGKSHLAKFIAVNAYGSEVWGPSAYRSDFRFDEAFSSRTFPLLFDDIHKYGSQKLQDLKAPLTENPLTFRGRGIGSVKLYTLAAVPIFTANEMVEEFENDTALLDRLITLELNEQLTPTKKREFREHLDDLVGISRGTVYAHHFIKELVDVANEVGGKSFIKGALKRWFRYAAEHNITDGRDPEKFAILLTGAELLAALLTKHGLDFNLDEAAKAILEVFKNKETLVPQPLHDLISLADKYEIGISLGDGLLIRNYDLTNIRTRVKGGNFNLPKRLRDIANILEGLGYPRTQTLPKQGHYVPELKKKVYGVLIPWGVVELVIGTTSEEGEDEEPSLQALDDVVNVLSMQEASFDELKQMTSFTDLTLAKALKKLEEMGLVWVVEGRYHLLRKKAKEAGFDIIDEISVGAGGD